VPSGLQILSTLIGAPVSSFSQHDVVIGRRRDSVTPARPDTPHVSTSRGDPRARPALRHDSAMMWRAFTFETRRSTYKPQSLPCIRTAFLRTLMTTTGHDSEFESRRCSG